MAFTVAEICQALDEDTSFESGWVRHGRGLVEPREAFIRLSAGCFYVRADGKRASGWRMADYSAQSFCGLSAWRIRRAMRRWGKRHPATPHKDPRP